jgi:hypothetical protein
MPTTGSRKIDTLIARAERAGLEVEVEITDTPDAGYDFAYRSVSVTVRRPRAEATNLLEQIQQAEYITAAWGWNRKQFGATPKLVFATKHGYLYDADRELTAGVLPYAIDGLAN